MPKRKGFASNVGNILIATTGDVSLVCEITIIYDLGHEVARGSRFGVACQRSKFTR